MVLPIAMVEFFDSRPTVHSHHCRGELERSPHHRWEHSDPDCVFVTAKWCGCLIGGRPDYDDHDEQRRIGDPRGYGGESKPLMTNPPMGFHGRQVSPGTTDP